MKQGDVELDAWVLATAAHAVAYAASLVRDRAAAEDLVQDCYGRLLEKADRYDLPRDGRKLLFTAVTRACINHLSRSRTLVSLDAADSEGGDFYDRLPDRAGEAPERILLRKELSLAVAEALALLPPSQRAAVELKGLGHSLEEIAAALEVTPNHAGVLIHRGRQTLARRLAPYLDESAS